MIIRIIYKKIRNKLPTNIAGIVSKCLFYTGLKPTVNNSIKRSFKKGVIVFSADFEMSWAFRFSKSNSQNCEEIGLKERENFPIILNLFNKFNIPVTWAIVGHLFLEKCDKSKEGIPHNNLPRPLFFENKNWIFKEGDWYQHDPCSNYLLAPSWYAPDLIKLIINSPVNHEIACHTFSHIDCTYTNCSNELLDKEIKECIREAQKLSIDLKSFVFPGGTFGNYEVLKKNQFICYRKPTNYHIDMPYIDKHDLVVIPSSFGLDRDIYGWTKEFHIKLLNKFIDKTIKNKKICHFWFHPSMDKWYIDNVLPQLLQIIAIKREKNLIEVLTMKDCALKFKKEFNE